MLLLLSSAWMRLSSQFIRRLRLWEMTTVAPSPRTTEAGRKAGCSQIDELISEMVVVAAAVGALPAELCQFHSSSLH